MDSQRMDLLYAKAENMGDTLLDMLDQYRTYTEISKPAVAVLCSENSLRLEMEKLFSVREDISADIYGTYDGSTSNSIYNIMLSDVAVVCTRAKNIAPKGMYDVLKQINFLGKPLFVLLSGWENLARNPEMARNRAARVDIEFNFARIVSVSNIFREELEGYTLPEAAVDALCTQFVLKREEYRRAQEEALYGYAKDKVEHFYEESKMNIQGEITAVNNKIASIITKQESYVIKYANLTVAVQDIVDGIIRSVKQINFYDISSPDESLKEIFERGRAEAQTFAKKFVTQSMINDVRKFADKQSENGVRISAQAVSDECLAEMQQICAAVSTLSHIRPEMLCSLKEAVADVSEIDRIVDRYDRLADGIVESVQKSLPGRIRSYEYDNGIGIKIKDVGADILKRLQSDADDWDTNGDTFPQEDETEEEEESRRFAEFQADTVRMIDYARDVLDDLANDYAAAVKDDIKKNTGELLKSYFGRITTVLETMDSELENTMNSYSMG